jgi:hypothetical protein
MTFGGSCNRDLFEMWLEECLLPQLQPGDIIVIDNASFHYSPMIIALLSLWGIVNAETLDRTGVLPIGLRF